MGAGIKFGDIDNTKVPNLALNKILCHNITLVVLFTFQFEKKLLRESIYTKFIVLSLLKTYYVII